MTSGGGVQPCLAWATSPALPIGSPRLQNQPGKITPSRVGFLAFVLWRQIPAGMISTIQILLGTPGTLSVSGRTMRHESL